MRLVVGTPEYERAQEATYIFVQKMLKENIFIVSEDAMGQLIIETGLKMNKENELERFND